MYIQESVSWTIGFAIPAAAMLLAVVTFVAGSSKYVHVEPTERYGIAATISLHQLTVAAPLLHPLSRIAHVLHVHILLAQWPPALDNGWTSVFTICLSVAKQSGSLSSMASKTWFALHILVYHMLKSMKVIASLLGF